MYYTPLNYEHINLKAGTYNPSMVKSYNNKTFSFWERALFQRACSTLKFEVPEEWNGNIKDFLYYVLFKYGYCAVSQNDKYGFFFQPCTLNGYNFYYQPLKAIISNPLMQKEMEIGKDCELIKLTPDYYGVWDIIQYYAEKLSVLDNAINMSLINNKFAFLWGARNKAAGEALKKMLDKVNKGEPAVIYDQKLLNDPTDKEIPFQIIDRPNLKSSYLTTDQLQDFQTLLNNFDCEIGIPTLPYQKKERMVVSEAEARTVDATSRSITWYETIKNSINKVKILYPDITLSVSLRYDPEKAGDSNEQNDINRNE